MRHPAIFCVLLAIALPTMAQAPQPYNCESIPEHRQFDFWVGSWEVTDETGETTYGYNTISSQANGCLLLEEYSSVKKFTGKSLNYFNPSNRQWHQHWVDNGSSIIHTSGGIKDGAMVMEGSIYYLGSGKTAPFRGTWTPLEDGRVRQFFEQQDDAGEWQTWFDGYYRRTD